MSNPTGKAVQLECFGIYPISILWLVLEEDGQAIGRATWPPPPPQKKNTLMTCPWADWGPRTLLREFLFPMFVPKQSLNLLHYVVEIRPRINTATQNWSPRLTRVEVGRVQGWIHHLEGGGGVWSIVHIHGIFHIFDDVFGICLIWSQNEFIVI